MVERDRRKDVDDRPKKNNNKFRKKRKTSDLSRIFTYVFLTKSILFKSMMQKIALIQLVQLLS